MKEIRLIDQMNCVNREIKKRKLFREKKKETNNVIDIMNREIDEMEAVGVTVLKSMSAEEICEWYIKEGMKFSEIKEKLEWLSKEKRDIAIWNLENWIEKYTK